MNIRVLILLCLTVLLVSCVQKAQQPEQAIDPNIETQEDQPFQQEGEEIIEQDVEPEQNTQEDLTQGETSEVRCGDGVCASSETEEDCPVDCKNCGDQNECTKDYFDTEIGQCYHTAIEPCCGNKICEKEVGENCQSCIYDCLCTAAGQLSSFPTLFSGKEMIYLYSQNSAEEDKELFAYLQQKFNFNEGNFMQENQEIDLYDVNGVIVGNPCTNTVLYNLLTAARGRSKYKIESICRNIVPKGEARIELIPTSNRANILAIVAETPAERMKAATALLHSSSNGFKGTHAEFELQYVNELGMLNLPQETEEETEYAYPLDFSVYPKIFLNDQKPYKIYVLSSLDENTLATDMRQAIADYLTVYFAQYYPGEIVTVYNKKENQFHDDITNTSAILIGDPFESELLAEIVSKREWDSEINEKNVGQLQVYTHKNHTQIMITGSDLSRIIAAGRVLGFQISDYQLKGAKIKVSGSAVKPVVEEWK